MRDRLYDVVMSAYCGMSFPIATRVNLDDAKAAAKRFRQRQKALGCPVNSIGKAEWEIETPEDAAMIGDGEGILRIRRVQ